MSDRIEKIYEMLEQLGYTVSEEERAMLDGTHELFRKVKSNGIRTELDS